jgi:hypothetical protein
MLDELSFIVKKTRLVEKLIFFQNLGIQEYFLCFFYECIFFIYEHLDSTNN